MYHFSKRIRVRTKEVALMSCHKPLSSGFFHRNRKEKVFFLSS
ncbi:unnamed protein product [Brassica rapa subsp. trilocularis]